MTDREAHPRTNDRTVRVFVSSTFLDMRAERDILVTVVFPELRERIERLGLELLDIDLRWGVPATGVDGERTNSWAYCKRWIERAEPFFICMLGQRYGSCPPAEEIDDMDDRRAYAGLSITEMEVRHAVLSRRLHRRSFFYVRESTVPPETPIDTYRKFVDDEPLLSSLTTAIRDTSGRPVRPYSCRWSGSGFEDLERFGEVVLDDLWSGVLREERYVAKDVWRAVLGHEPDVDPIYYDERRPLPPELWEPIVARVRPPAADPLDTERAQIAAFASARLRWFRGRAKQLQELRTFLDEDNPLCVVRAVAGQGKSALLAKLAEELEAGPHVTVTHYVGATERTIDIRTLLERLVAELDRNGIPCGPTATSDPDPLKQDFISRLESYAGARRVVLLLDGIAQLPDGHDFSWLPLRFGSNVRVILTALDAPDDVVLAALRRRTPEPRWIDLSPLEAKDIREIVSDLLREYGKELDPTEQDAICRMQQATNPLYLLVMLHELRTVGNDIHEILAAFPERHPDTASIFDWMLERLEFFGVDAARRWWTYLTLGRTGMSGRELSELLRRTMGEEGARAALRIERSVRRYLQRRGGQWDFFHGQLREAVRRRYGTSDDAARHAEIAAYFATRWRQQDRHAIAELPHHLTRAGTMWEELRDTLCDLDFVEAKCAAGMTYDLVSDFETAEASAPAAFADAPRWREWKQFVTLHAATFERFLAAHSDLVFQTAFNGAATGDVAAVARKRLHDGRTLGQAWIERRNRPRSSSESACDRAFAGRGPRFEALTPVTAVWGGQTVDLWSLTTGKTIARSRQLHAPVARFLTTAHDALVVCLEDGTLHLLDPETAEILGGEDTGLDKPFLTTSGNLLLWSSTSGADFAANVLDLTGGTASRRFSGHHGTVRKIIMLDEQLVATTSADQALRVWDRRSGSLERTIPGQINVDTEYVVIPPRRAVSYVTRARSQSAADEADRTLLVWDLDLGLCIHRLASACGRVQSMAVVDRGAAVCVFGDRGTEVWEVESGTLRDRIPLRPSSMLLASTADQTQGILLADEDHLLLWNFASGVAERRFRMRRASAPVALTEDGLLIAASRTHAPEVWELASGRHLATLAGHGAAVESIRTFDHRCVVTRASDSSVLVWNVRRLRAGVHAAAVEATGSRPVILGPRDAAVLDHERIQLWDLEDGALRRVLRGHSADVAWVGTTAGGTIVSTATDDTLRMWDARTGRCTAVLSGHDDELTATILIDNRAITASRDGTCRVWDLVDGRCLRVLPGDEPVVRLERLPGMSVLAVHWDGSLRVWDVEPGACRSEIRTGYSIHALVLLADLRVVVCGGFFEQRGALQVYDLGGQRLVHTLAEGMEYLSAMAGDGERLVVTAEPFGQIRVWDVEVGACRHFLVPPEVGYHHAFKLRVMPDRRLVAQCNDGVRTWDVDRGEYHGLRRETFEVLTEACAATDDGVLWQGVLYPLNGEPVLAAIGDRAILTEKESGIVHVLRRRNVDDVAEAPPATLAAEDLVILTLNTAGDLADSGHVDEALSALEAAEALASDWSLALRCFVEHCRIRRRASRTLEPADVDRLAVALEDDRLNPATTRAGAASALDWARARAASIMTELLARGGAHHLATVFDLPSAANMKIDARANSPIASVSMELESSLRQLLEDVAAASSEPVANRAIALDGLANPAAAEQLLVEAEQLARREGHRDLLALLLRIRARGLLKASGHAATAIALLEQAEAIVIDLEESLALKRMLLAALEALATESDDTAGRLALYDRMESVATVAENSGAVYAARVNRAMARSELLGEHVQAIAALEEARKGLRRLGAVKAVAQCDEALRVVRQRISAMLEALERAAESAFDDGQPETALARIDERIELCRLDHGREDRARALTERAYVLQHLGREGEAASALAEARGIAAELHLHHILERIDALDRQEDSP